MLSRTTMLPEGRFQQPRGTQPGSPEGPMNLPIKSLDRSHDQLVPFLRDHAVWFTFEALVITIFMVVHLGISVETSTHDIDFETCVVGLACGACIGGITMAIVACTGLVLLTAADFWSRRA